MVSSNMIDPAIFEQLQLKIDEDVKAREELRNTLQGIEKQGKVYIIRSEAVYAVT